MCTKPCTWWRTPSTCYCNVKMAQTPPVESLTTGNPATGKEVKPKLESSGAKKDDVISIYKEKPCIFRVSFLLQVMEHIKYVNFTTKYGSKDFFDENGDSVAQYDLVNWQMTEDGSAEGQCADIYPDSGCVLYIWANNQPSVPFDKHDLLEGENHFRVCLRFSCWILGYSDLHRSPCHPVFHSCFSHKAAARYLQRS